MTISGVQLDCSRPIISLLVMMESLDRSPPVGEEVGEAVGAAVGELVGEEVGEAVGAAVGEAQDVGQKST